MGQKNCKIQTSKGRGVRQQRSSNQKNIVNTNYAHLVRVITLSLSLHLGAMQK